MDIDRLRTASKECEKILMRIWGHDVKYRIMEGDQCKEDVEQGVIYCSEMDMREWGYSIAKEANLPKDAGERIVLGHSLSHLYARKLNGCMYQETTLHHPSLIHVLTVAAVVDVATKWMLDEMGYDGSKLMKVRQKKLEQRQKKLFKHYMEIYDSLVGETPQKLVEFVENYKMDSERDSFKMLECLMGE